MKIASCYSFIPISSSLFYLVPLHSYHIVYKNFAVRNSFYKNIFFFADLFRSMRRLKKHKNPKHV